MQHLPLGEAEALTRLTVTDVFHRQPNREERVLQHPFFHRRISVKGSIDGRREGVPVLQAIQTAHWLGDTLVFLRPLLAGKPRDVIEVTLRAKALVWQLDSSLVYLVATFVKHFPYGTHRTIIINRVQHVCTTGVLPKSRNYHGNISGDC
jgi:hypothetical protein